MLQDGRSKPQTLECDLKSVVFGQNPAIDALTPAIRMSRTGLGRTDKPIGSFPSSGPAGVSKTEVARQLAFTLGIELIRFDMLEYIERHAVSQLIGAPPGYMGSGQGSLLTEVVTKRPYCMLLLDETEKAHPDTFNILLQVMNHSVLTDNNGCKADFRNVIIVMTINAGTKTMSRTTIGFTTARERGGEMVDIKRMFTPGSRSHLDAATSSRSPDGKITTRVVDKSPMQLKEQLHEKKVDAIFTERLRCFLAEKGFDPLVGTRPMQRLVQDLIRKVSVDELLFGKLVNGGKVVVDLDDADAVKLEFSENEAPPIPVQEEAEVWRACRTK